MTHKEFVDIANYIIVKSKEISHEVANVAAQPKKDKRKENNQDKPSKKQKRKRAPPESKDLAEYAREWRERKEQFNDEGKCEFCDQLNHGAVDCFYLAGVKPPGWKPFSGIWCYFKRQANQANITALAVVASATTSTTDKWLLNSGASKNITKNMTCFIDYRDWPPCEKPL